MRPLNFDTPVIDEFGDIHTLEEYAGGGGATDISEKEVSFISDDELNPSAEKVVSVMTTGSKLKDLMSLLSKAVSNLRYVLSFIKSNRDMITDEYDSTRSYVVDDYCTHNGIVYKCIVNTSGTFNDSDWLDTTITTELSGLNNSIANKQDKETNTTDSIRVVMGQIGAWSYIESNSFHIPNGKTPTLTNAFFFNTDGTQTDVTSSVSLGKIGNNNYYVSGRLSTLEHKILSISYNLT